MIGGREEKKYKLHVFDGMTEQKLFLSIRVCDGILYKNINLSVYDVPKIGHYLAE